MDVAVEPSHQSIGPACVRCPDVPVRHSGTAGHQHQLAV